MNPDLARAVGVAIAAAESLRIDAVLIGATVSELAAQEMHLALRPRGTQDADFAVQIRNWDDFNRLKRELAARGFRPATHVEHRFSRGTALVDIVPYGLGVTNERGEIKWPNSEHALVVIGFEEACADTRTVTLHGGVRAKHVTVPGLALLKIVAFEDRRSRGDRRYRNDAEDLMYWLKHYASGDAEDRRYDLPALGLSDIEFDHAGAAVLGLDVSALVATALSDGRVREFVQNSTDLYGDFANAVVRPGSAREDQEREHVVKLVQALGAGYVHRRPPDGGAAPHPL